MRGRDGRLTRWLWAVPVVLAGCIVLPFWILFTGTELAQALGGRVLRPILKAADRGSEKRGVAGLSGVTLVLVPTLFAMFPAWSRWPLVAKVAVLVAWLIAATIIVARTIRTEGRIAHLSHREVATEKRVRTETLRIAVNAILTSYALPDGYMPQIFLPDQTRSRLIPAVDPRALGPEDGWRIDQDPAQAVTGAAWANNAYVFAKGPAISNVTYGLTEEQQRRYADLTGVSAAPIRDQRGAPLGVLTVCTKEPEPLSSDQAFVERQVALATALGTVLADLGGTVANA